MFVSSMGPVIQIQDGETHENISPSSSDDDKQHILVSACRSIKQILIIFKFI